jgi:hypothetical protein
VLASLIVHGIRGRKRPHGWSLNVLRFALLPRQEVLAVVRSSVNGICWAAADAPGRHLGFDHAQQTQWARIAPRHRMQNHTLALYLLPVRLTLTQRQRVCNAIPSRGPAQPVGLGEVAPLCRFVKSPDIAEVADAFGSFAQRSAQLSRIAPGLRFNWADE